jgi:hypothetical protein
LAQAESEWHWLAVCVGAGRCGEGAEAGAGRRAGTETGAGQLVARDAAVVPERTRGFGAADEPALVVMRHREQ